MCQQKVCHNMLTIFHKNGLVNSAGYKNPCAKSHMGNY